MIITEAFEPVRARCGSPYYESQFLTCAATRNGCFSVFRNAMASNSVMSDIGTVDNLNEPERFMNRKDVILGIIVSFLVCLLFWTTCSLCIGSVSNPRNVAGCVLDRCDRTVIYSIQNNSELRMG